MQKPAWDHQYPALPSGNELWEEALNDAHPQCPWQHNDDFDDNGGDGLWVQALNILHILIWECSKLMQCSKKWPKSCWERGLCLSQVFAIIKWVFSFFFRMLMELTRPDPLLYCCHVLSCFYTLNLQLQMGWKVKKNIAHLGHSWSRFLCDHPEIEVTSYRHLIFLLNSSFPSHSPNYLP